MPVQTIHVCFLQVCAAFEKQTRSGANKHMCTLCDEWLRGSLLLCGFVCVCEEGREEARKKSVLTPLDESCSRFAYLCLLPSCRNLRTRASLVGDHRGSGHPTELETDLVVVIGHLG